MASRVLLVDDHEIVRRGLTQIINQEPDLEVCGEAEEVPAAIRQIATLKPDAVIVDLSLKEGGSGIELIKQVRGSNRALPLLVLSMHSEAFHVERALRAGASGYLTKEEASEKVLTALRAVLRGEMYVSDRLSGDVLKRLVLGSAEEEGADIDRLSDREFQVFQMIGDGKGTQEVADALHLSVKTIETYRENIKEKLGLENSRQLLLYAVRWTLSQKNG